MLDSLKLILALQELDMKMLRLMKVKKERQNELSHLYTLKTDLSKQLSAKEQEIQERKKDMRLAELSIEEIRERGKKLQDQQNLVKKVDEFNALSQEIAGNDRQRIHKETQLSELMESLQTEEQALRVLQENIQKSETSSRSYENELLESIRHINEEGREIKKERDVLKDGADEELLLVYERLLCNKQDRVVVPIENRACGGCHIVLTAQHENSVRKGERLFFCEHCSRIHFWPQSHDLLEPGLAGLAGLAVDSDEETAVTTKRRRRKATVTA